jgi:hypothetical protein
MVVSASAGDGNTGRRKHTPAQYMTTCDASHRFGDVGMAGALLGRMNAAQTSASAPPRPVVVSGMRQSRGLAGVTVSVVLAAAAATGCTTTAGTPVARTASAAPSSQAPAESTAKAAEPTGAPVGTAVMQVIGGSAPVTIRYRINGGAPQTESNVTLPWEKQYSVYERLESEVAADGGSAGLTCTIMMDGDKLVSFNSDVKPVCNFAYWG